MKRRTMLLIATGVWGLCFGVQPAQCEVRFLFMGPEDVERQIKMTADKWSGGQA